MLVYLVSFQGVLVISHGLHGHLQLIYLLIYLLHFFHCLHQVKYGFIGSSFVWKKILSKSSIYIKMQHWFVQEKEGQGCPGGAGPWPSLSFYKVKSQPIIAFIMFKFFLSLWFVLWPIGCSVESTGEDGDTVTSSQARVLEQQGKKNRTLTLFI